MEGVSTSTAGFVGLAERGPVEGLPELVTNVSDFFRKFGGYLSENEFGGYRYLAYAVEHFFINGGSRCFVMRVAPSDAKAASSCPSGDETVPVVFTAKNPGAWGDKVRILVTKSSKAKTQIYDVLGDGKYLVKNNSGFNPGDVVAFSDGKDVTYSKVETSQDNIIKLSAELSGNVVDKNLLPKKTLSTCEFNLEVRYEEIVETYENVSLNVAAANFIEKKLSKSDLVQVWFNAQAAGDEIVHPYAVISGGGGATEYIIALSNGSNGSAANVSASTFVGEDKGPGKRTGIQAFIDNDEVSIMAVPGITDPNVQLSLVAHCENLGSRFAILDIPREKKKVSDVTSHREMFDSHYAAMYHPWLTVFDPYDKKNIAIPPSGSIAGIYSRTDQERGVFKAPANEVVRACIGLDCQYNKGEQDILNPRGVNLIRNLTGQGIRVWGARTCSSNSLWKYVNVRRLFIFLEESIKRNTNWVVFEPNDEPLWTRVQRTIDIFLTGVWRAGALAGSTPAEAFFVEIGRTTMSQDDIDNGRLVCVIGCAPVKPAEFVIFRITQKTANA